MERQQAEPFFRIPAAVAVVVVLLASAVPFVGPLIRDEVFSFRDHSDYFIPLRFFTSAALKGGELPLWNPFNASGERWLANPQTGVFYPPSWIFLIVPFSAAYLLYLWLHLAILGLGAFLLFSRWCSGAAAMIASIALMLCGPTLSILDVSNNLATFAWFPTAITIALGAGAAKSALPASAGAAVISLMFLGGEPFLALIGAVLYSVVFLVSNDGWTWRGRAGRLVLTGMLATLLSAAQLLPFLELLRGSDRMAHGGADALSESIALRDWIATVIPAPGPSGGVGALELSQRYILSIYLGVLIVFAAGMAAIRALKIDRSRQRAVAGILGLLLVVMILAAGKWISLVALLWTRLGLDLNRFPARLIPLVALGVTALAAMGLDLAGELPRRWRVAAILLLVALLGLAAFVFPPRAASRWPWMVMIGWVLVIGLLMQVRRGLLVPAIVVGLMMVDFMVAARPLLVSRPFDRSLEPYRSQVQPPWKVIRLFEYGTPPLRIADRQSWLHGYLNLLIGCFDATTAAPVVPRQYPELHDRAVTEPRHDLVDFLSAAFLATSREISHPDYAPVARSGAVTLFRKRGVLPPAQLWTSTRSAASASQAFDELLRPGHDARRSVILSCRPGERCRVPGMSEQDRPVRPAALHSFGLGRVVVEVRSETPAVLVLNQLDAAGWGVRVNGRPAQPLRANGLFRAVALDPGRHRVVWTYRPGVLILGVIGTMIGLLVAGAEVFRVRRRRSRAGRERRPGKLLCPFFEKSQDFTPRRFFSIRVPRTEQDRRSGTSRALLLGLEGAFHVDY